MAVDYLVFVYKIFTSNFLNFLTLTRSNIFKFPKFSTSPTRNFRDFGFPYMVRYWTIQDPSTLSEYGPSTAGEIERPKTAVVERAQAKSLQDG